MNDTLAATDGALLAVLLGDLRDEVHKDQRIDPLFDEGGDVLGEFQFVAVVAAGGVGSLELADGAVTDEDDMDAALAELFEQGEKAGELLGEINETLAVAEILKAILVCFATDFLDEKFFGPVDRVDDERLVTMLDREQVGDRGEQLGPRTGTREAGDVEMGGAALGVDEHRFGETGGERSLADALGPVEGEARGAWDETARDGDRRGGFSDGRNGHGDESHSRQAGRHNPGASPPGSAGGGDFGGCERVTWPRGEFPKIRVRKRPLA